jgi:tetratricopeptide (TPR) repeat protein
MPHPDDEVLAREETVVIPTYPAPPPDPNPMFLDRRIYQGSSGRVYPNPVTDRVADQRVDRAYQAVFLENRYLEVMILPELGGRVHAVRDKTNGYDLVYRQHVIKPALVGLLGPWISGGIEFNWPQHHRPSTFMPVEHAIEARLDGSQTVWLSEHEPMSRMKGMLGLRLHPGRALLEAEVRLYNRTPTAQTFLWWANVAVSVHDQYQAFFPPDVEWVCDHAKRAVSRFPIARGHYYGVDYTRGVDIRWYRNIPVPTSYMVLHSDYDFFGGYDHAREAGLVHVADRHAAPGKKLWTWGSAAFGQAWDRELTDSDGPYIELMAGVFTDNQPDFSWLRPYETRTFKQHWYPIQRIGPPSNATLRGALSLDAIPGGFRLGAAVTEPTPGAVVRLAADGAVLFERGVDLAPDAPLVAEVAASSALPVRLSLHTAGGEELVAYELTGRAEAPPPQPASEPPPPVSMASAEELYLTGLHLAQYRHATRDPTSYWQEALRRDPGDARCHNVLGLRRLREGRLADAEEHFRTALATLTRRNPNPRDGEAFYNLGLSLDAQGRDDEARAAFAKAAWDGAWRGPASYESAALLSRQGRLEDALDALEEALAVESRHLKARHLKTALLRRQKQVDAAESLVLEGWALDRLDFASWNERALIARLHGDEHEAEDVRRSALEVTRGSAGTALDIAFDYAHAGLLDEARELLLAVAGSGGAAHAMVLYVLGDLGAREGRDDEARDFRARARAAAPDYVFPSRLEELLVLERACVADPDDPRAHGYLGLWLYNAGRREEAIDAWETSVRLDPGHSVTWRNLGMAVFNVLGEAERARACYARARAANPRDARLLYEQDQLEKRLGTPAAARLSSLEAHPELVARRDDLALERVLLLLRTGAPARALEVLESRRFHPWEGGEGRVCGAWAAAHAALARAALEAGAPGEALVHAAAARAHPPNLGEARHPLVSEAPLHYLQGLAQDALNNPEAARGCYERAASATPEGAPETYHRCLALLKLGRSEESEATLRGLLAFTRARENQTPTIDYFATSLPDFLLFEDDLARRHRVECLFLTGLAQLGLGAAHAAREAFAEVLELDPSHLGAAEEHRRL